MTSRDQALRRVRILLNLTEAILRLDDVRSNLARPEDKAQARELVDLVRVFRSELQKRLRDT